MSTTFTGLNSMMPPEAAPRLGRLAAQKQKIDDEAEAYVREVQEGVRAFLVSVQWFDEGFRTIRSDVSNGWAVAVQGIREVFLDTFQGQLKLLHEASDLARHASRVAGRELPEVPLLDAEVEGLGRRLLCLAARWQTVEDLAGLTEESIRGRVTPVELRRLTREQRQAITRRSAELAEVDYRTNRELLGFEAFGEKDIYDAYPDAE